MYFCIVKYMYLCVYVCVCVYMYVGVGVCVNILYVWRFIGVYGSLSKI